MCKTFFLCITMPPNNSKWRKLARNGACQICGFDRYVEICHLVPKRIGGGHKSENILLLCPNHHRLLDNGLLNREEIASIERRVIEMVEVHKEDMKIQEYLYFILRLKNNPPKWLKICRGHWIHKESNCY